MKFFVNILFGFTFYVGCFWEAFNFRHKMEALILGLLFGIIEAGLNEAPKTYTIKGLGDFQLEHEVNGERYELATPTVVLFL